MDKEMIFEIVEMFENNENLKQEHEKSYQILSLIKRSIELNDELQKITDNIQELKKEEE